MRVPHNKLYDESKILYEIYRMRGLTVNQMVEVMFQSKWYAYRYLRNLEEQGLLSYIYDTEGRKRVAKVYVCTDVAIERLEKEGYIEKGVKAKDNTPHKAKLKYTILTNEVYAALTPYGIHMYDSREWKRRYGMDRNSMVRGGLRMADGREIGLYLFFSKKQYKDADFSRKMVERFKREIEKFPQSNRIAVICYDEATYDELIEEFEKDDKPLSKEELLIIPIGKDNFGYNLLRMNRSEIERKAVLEQILNARLLKEHAALKGNRQLFAQYIADYSDREMYVVDFLSLNRPIIRNLITHYFDRAFEIDGRQVNLVCWNVNKEMDRLYGKLIRYPHVNIVPIPTKTLAETYISKIEKTKLI